MRPRWILDQKRLPLAVFLLFYLVFSLGTFRHYGPSWDEQDTYQGGTELYGYLTQGVTPHYLDPEHSYPYPFLLRFLTDRTDDYDLFHLLNLLFAGFLFAGLYEALWRQTGRPWLSLAGPLFLFLCPQFMGSVPANPKDIPFAIFYFLSLAFLFLKEGQRTRWAFAGVLFGFAMASRIVAFTLLPLMILFDLYLFWTGSGEKKRGQFKAWLPGKALEWSGTFALSQVLCAILWPYLGRDYFQHLPQIFWVSAHFPPKFGFLFMGSLSDSLSYPWIYLPVMIGVTTPLFLLVFFIVSFFMPGNWKSNRLFALMGGAFLFNFLLYFGMRPAIYDGLRHFLYLLPILVTLAALGFIEIFKNGIFHHGGTENTEKTKRIQNPLPFFPRSFLRVLRASVVKTLGFLVLLSMGMTALQMVKLHPYEYLYYNEWVGGAKGAYGKFETDYWVEGMREAVEWLKANEIRDPARTYKIRADGKAFQSKTYFRQNMMLVEKDGEADYSLVMTRNGIKPGPEDLGKVIHRVERDGVPLVFVLKMK